MRHATRFMPATNMMLADILRPRIRCRCHAALRYDAIRRQPYADAMPARIFATCHATPLRYAFSPLPLTLTFAVAATIALPLIDAAASLFRHAMPIATLR